MQPLHCHTNHGCGCCWCRCVFQTSNCIEGRQPAVATDWSQSVQLESSRISSSCPTGDPGMRPTHRLQHQSLPVTASASHSEQQGLPGLNAARPGHNAASTGLHAASTGINAAGSVVAGHMVGQPETAGLLSDRKQHAADSESEEAPLLNLSGVAAGAAQDCSASQLEASGQGCHNVNATGSVQQQQQFPAVMLSAARPKGLGLRLPWLTNKATDATDQVTSQACAPLHFTHSTCTNLCT